MAILQSFFYEHTCGASAVENSFIIGIIKHFDYIFKCTINITSFTLHRIQIKSHIYVI